MVLMMLIDDGQKFLSAIGNENEFQVFKNAVGSFFEESEPVCQNLYSVDFQIKLIFLFVMNREICAKNF